MLKAITKKRMFILIAIISVIVILLAAVLAWPYIKIEKTVKDLSKSDYEFTMDYSVTGFGLTDELKEFSGKVEGKKCDNKLKGNIFVEDNKYFEIYAEKGGEYVFNVRPVAKKIINKVGAKMPVSLGLFANAVPDIFISLQQLIEITDNEELKSFENLELFSNVKSENSYHIQKIDTPVGLENQKMNFFQITFETVEADVILGVSKSFDNSVYLNVSYSDVELTAELTYTKTNLKEIKMPEENVPESTISLLKDIYSAWKSR